MFRHPLVDGDSNCQKRGSNEYKTFTTKERELKGSTNNHTKDFKRAHAYTHKYNVENDTTFTS